MSKLFVTEVDSCLFCPKIKECDGGFICGFTDGRAVSLNTDKPIPEWCPLPDKDVINKKDVTAVMMLKDLK